MTNLLRILAAAGALSLSFGAMSEDSKHNAALSSVEGLASVLSDGYSSYHPEFTDVAFGQITGNGPADVVALFSVEGFGKSNMHYEYLAVFSAVPVVDPEDSITPKPFRLIAFAQIGGKSIRSFLRDSLRIERDAILVDGKQYSEGDPACCPSVPFSVVFRLRNGVLVEHDG